MPVIVEVNAFRCRVWHSHDRMEEHVSEKTCEAEIRSFQAHGQLVPAIGRRLVNDPDYDVEIICGVRRLFVARYLSRPLTIELREMTDRECFVAMDMENRQRKEVSPYERGLSYARWLRMGHFESQEDLGRAFSISTSQVSRLLKLARLPTVIVNAFPSATDIREGWGGELADALSDPDKRDILIKTARKISESRRKFPARDVYRQLLGAAVQGRKPKLSRHDRVVKGSNGAPVFRIRRQVSSIALILPADSVSEQSLRSIETALLNILGESSFNPVADGLSDQVHTESDSLYFAPVPRARVDGLRRAAAP